MAECGLDVAGARERLTEARVHAEEVAREVRELVSNLAEDPSELEAVESRLHRLEQLMLKYGSPLERVLEHRDELMAERLDLDGVEDRLSEAEAAAAASLAEYDRRAGRLDAARREAGRSLTEAVEAVLAKLDMAGTTLRFRWQPRPDDRSPLRRDGQPVAFDEGGVDLCELQIAANPGEEPRSMARIASGGELSRIHLAVRTVLLGPRRGSGLTLLFDEVDSGLGGTAAAALAGLLADLAVQHQVLVVTHLPQVAARAAHHHRVEKVPLDGRAVTRVRVLDPDGREEEIARMLSGGQLTATARSHARTLLEGG
jgi:DNA repair protein RecN (Recombination protein N)